MAKVIRIIEIWEKDPRSDVRKFHVVFDEPVLADISPALRASGVPAMCDQRPSDPTVTVVGKAARLLSPVLVEVTVTYGPAIEVRGGCPRALLAPVSVALKEAEELLLAASAVLVGYEDYCREDWWGPCERCVEAGKARKKIKEFRRKHGAPG